MSGTCQLHSDQRIAALIPDNACAVQNTNGLICEDADAPSKDGLAQFGHFFAGAVRLEVMGLPRSVALEFFRSILQHRVTNTCRRLSWNAKDLPCDPQ
jgi:hypothetical protein